MGGWKNEKKDENVFVNILKVNKNKSDILHDTDWLKFDTASLITCPNPYKKKTWDMNWRNIVF